MQRAIAQQNNKNEEATKDSVNINFLPNLTC